MAPVDVDAVNERLNGLVTLLKAVGVESLDGKGGSSRGGIPDARQLDDDQIEAIIRKLQMAQTEAPQIIAALEAQSKLKKQQQQQQKMPREAQRSPPPPQQQQQRQHQQQEKQDDNDEGDDDDDDDDDDSYDEDANYPTVGHGCSDDVSVMSDLTTPTVCQGVNVPDEEHYRDTLPPMIVGGSMSGSHPPMLIAPTKRKNLVGSARSNTLAAPRSNRGTATKPPGASNHNSHGVGSSSGAGVGGAAAQRRKHYNATMEKLAHEPLHPQQYSPALQGSRKVKAPMVTNNNNGAGGAAASGAGGGAAPVNNSGSNPNTASTAVKRKVVKTARRASVSNGTAPVSDHGDWDSSAPQWNAFENTASTTKMSRPKATTLIDDDGFLMAGDSQSFDPFHASKTDNPFKSKTSFSGSSSIGDAPKDSSKPRRIKKKPAAALTPTGHTNNNNNSFDSGFEPPPSSQSQQQQSRSNTKPSHNSNSNNSSSNGSGSGSANGSVGAPKIRRSRRASLAM